MLGLGGLSPIPSGGSPCSSPVSHHSILLGGSGTPTARARDLGQRAHEERNAFSYSQLPDSPGARLPACRPAWRLRRALPCTPLRCSPACRRRPGC
jgi:hypothetical protein